MSEAKNSEQLLEALKSVLDPEIGINIVDLGLVYGIAVTPERIDVRMTMTSPTCPLGSFIASQVEDALRAATDDRLAVKVEFVREPRWTRAMMSPAAQAELARRR